ncbi:TPA: hypothetical protein DDX46_03335 [Candidatus Saccharibacteria bacterium]|nr:MAG: hypothetical protein UW38_C0001G0488 [Candidatus Saccharibacteria bacterium GW2011_GWC2_44_17]OGL33877.1 MAG: hypothetical protein A3E20_03985 [Candidatus Saccharibacteria bacterium RIFCSPHIGHO2_12_FULL_47_16]HBH77752.1 hypothetical protein [Candidatus Saccharibacteria bacterium]
MSAPRATLPSVKELVTFFHEQLDQVPPWIVSTLIDEHEKPIRAEFHYRHILFDGGKAHSVYNNKSHEILLLRDGSWLVARDIEPHPEIAKVKHYRTPELIEPFKEIGKRAEQIKVIRNTFNALFAFKDQRIGWLRLKKKIEVHVANAQP